jgi:hypothetical protein
MTKISFEIDPDQQHKDLPKGSKLLAAPKKVDIVIHRAAGQIAGCF